MFILTKDRKHITSTTQENIIYLKGDTIFHGDFPIGSYDTKEKAQAAFEDLIEQIDEIEGVARVK